MSGVVYDSQLQEILAKKYIICVSSLAPRISTSIVEGIKLYGLYSLHYKIQGIQAFKNYPQIYGIPGTFKKLH